MGEPLAPVGAAIFNYSGHKVGTVTRATDKSAWIGSSRYTLNFSGSLKRHGSYYAESFYADGTAAWSARQREIASEAENAAAEKAATEMCERIKTRLSNVTSRKRDGYKWAETQAERMARVAAVEAAVMAALDALEAP